MNLRAFDLNLLVVFDMLIQERSTTRAGDRLSMSQSAVSKALGRLRSLTGDELFTREPGGLVPTRRAEQIATPIRDALALIRNGIEPPQAFDFARSERTFRLAATHYVVDVVLHRLLDLLSMTAPGIAVQVDLLPLQFGRNPYAHIQSVLNGLQHGEIDLILHHDDTPFSNLRCQLLFEDPWERIVAHDVDESEVRGNVLTGIPAIDAALEAQGGPGLARVPSLSQLPTIVANTDLATMVPARLAARHAGQLRRRPTDAPALRTYQFWHENAHGGRAHKWLRQTLLNHARRV